MLYLTHARLPIDPFLVPSGGRTAAAVAALERSFGQQDEDMSSSLRRLNLSSTQDYSAMSPSPSFDTSSVGGSSSRTGTPGGTPSRPPVSNSYWDQHITSIRSPLQGSPPPPTMPKSSAVAARRQQLHNKQLAQQPGNVHVWWWLTDHSKG